MATPAVVFDNVSKKFQRGERHDSLRDLIPHSVGRLFRPRKEGDLRENEFWAVRDVSFEVRPGEALGIIGPNGAGKSTVLKLLTRILKPTSGTCAVRGRVGALIEVAAGFHPDLTGRENIFLQGAIMGMKRAEIATHLDDIIDFSGISAFIDTPVKRYSSGMNARLGFSIAAHLEPDVLLIDEVLAVGDVAFQERCIARMEAFLKAGVAMVFVSHNLHSVVQLCRRSVLLRSGQVAACGASEDVALEYSALNGTPSDSATEAVRVVVTAKSESSADGTTIRSGERIRVAVDADFKVARKDLTIGVVVREVTRNTYVYGATSDAVGVAPITSEPGMRLSFDFGLVAHLTRGLYSLEVNVFDPGEQKHLCVVNPAWQFRVIEDVSYGGVANLHLQAMQVESAQPLIVA